MPRLRELAFPRPSDEIKAYKQTLFENESADREKYTGFTFEFCSFERMGFRGTIFEQCTFRHCEFINCYLVGAEFVQANLIGSEFKGCAFTRTEFDRTNIDYVRFFDCAPVLQQISHVRPRTPQAAAKLFRNLAIEHKNLGNWQQVDRLVIESFKERQRHYKYVFKSENEHYQRHYSGKKLSYFTRYILSITSGAIWGYGVSWTSFLRSMLLTALVILPAINGIFGRMPQSTSVNLKYTTISNLLFFLGQIYKASLEAFLPFIPPQVMSSETMFKLPFLLVAIEAVLGSVFIALFVSLLFRSSSKGAL